MAAGNEEAAHDLLPAEEVNAGKHGQEHRSHGRKSGPVDARQVYNSSLTDSTLPYFYIGVDNALEIDWNGLKPEEHSVSISGGGGSITKYSESRFVVRTTSVTDECYIRISNKKGKILFKQPYNVRAIEYSQLSLGGIESGITTTKEQILSNPFLDINCKNCYYKLRIQIVSFVLAVEINEHIARSTRNR